MNLGNFPRASFYWVIGAVLGFGLLMAGPEAWERLRNQNVAIPVKIVDAPTPPTTTTLPPVHHRETLSRPMVHEETNPLKRAWNAVTGIFR